jgi:transcriptional regulator with XRE-family HTH domain
MFATANLTGWEIPSFPSEEPLMDLLKHIGENIRRRIQSRSDYGSIELFAHENQIPKSTLSEILNGKNDPKLTTLAKICSGLEIPLADLFMDPAIESWVRESAGKYNPRSRHSTRKSPKGKGDSKK